MSGGEAVDWTVLIPRFARLIHPTKVLIVEAMMWIDQSVSASQLARTFDKSPSLPDVSYHMREMLRLGVLELVGDRKVRGATEVFYAFAKHKGMVD